MRNKRSGHCCRRLPFPARLRRLPIQQRLLFRRHLILRQMYRLFPGCIRQGTGQAGMTEWKQNFYDEVLTGKRPYVSNLIRVEDSQGEPA